MTNNTHAVFVCPDCRGRLTAEPRGYLCATCSILLLPEVVRDLGLSVAAWREAYAELEPLVRAAADWANGLDQ